MHSLLLLIAVLFAAPDGGDAPPPAGPDPRIRALVRDLGSEDWDTRERAYKELRKLGEAAYPALTEALDDPDLDVQRAAAHLLGAAELSRDRRLLRKLRSRSPKFPESKTFRDLVALGRDAVPLLFDALRTELSRPGQADYTTLRNAYAILRELAEAGVLGRDDVPDLIRLMDNSSPHPRQLGRPILQLLAGEDLSEILVDVFRREDASAVLRANALDVLDSTRYEGMLALVTEALSDEASPVRIAGARSLWRYASEETLPLLLEAADDVDPEVRSAVVRALQRLPERREARAVIRAALDDPDEEVRRDALNAAAALVERTSDRTFLPGVRRQLQDGDPAVVSAAAQLLGRVRDRDALPHLLPLLETEDADLRLRILPTVVMALGRIGDPLAAKPLRAFLQDDDHAANPTARVYAVQALLLIEGDSALPLAEKTLEEDTQFAPQILYPTLLQTPGRRRIPLLVKGLESGNRIVVARCAVGLGQAGAREAAPRLATMLADSTETYLRQSLLEALGALANPETGADLLALLESLVDESGESPPSNSWHARLACMALGAMGHRPAEDVLLRVLSARGRNSSAAATALARIGSRKAVEPLRALLAEREGNPDAAYPLATALARLGGREPLEALRKHYETALETSPDAGSVLRMAADAAMRLGHAERALTLARRRVELSPDEGNARYDLACLLALGGKTQEALKALDQARVRGYRNVRDLLLDEDLESLRDEPELREIVVRMNRR